MNKRKIKFIFSLYFILLVISSCCDTDTYYVQITGINFFPVNSFVLEDENFEFKLKSSDSIVGMAWNGFDLKLTQSAYAYDCDSEDTYETIETVNDFKVKTLTDFSDSYQSNDYITNLINVRFYSINSNGIETMTLANFFENYIRDFGYATARSAEFQNATYILSERPTISNEQQFELEFILTDNSTFTTLTEIITWE